MLQDLRKHIMSKILNIDDDVYWLKKLCECSKDEVLANSIIENIEENADTFDMDVSSFFSGVVEWRYHLDDALDVEFAMLKLLISCFYEKYEIVSKNYGVADMWFYHTTRGNELLGNQPEELDKIDTIFDRWFDLNEFFNHLSDEEILMYRKVGKFDEDFEENTVNYVNILVDKEAEGYSLISYLLNELDFLEIEPGAFVYASISYCGELTGCDDLYIQTLIAIDSYLVKQRDFSECDHVFESCVLDKNKYLNSIFNMEGSSRRDVIF